LHRYKKIHENSKLLEREMKKKMKQLLLFALSTEFPVRKM